VETKEELPIIESISIYKLPDLGNNGWVVLKIKSQGDKIVDIASSEANLKEITIEQAKIEFIKMFANHMV
jgi:hypothetical protein